MPDGYIAGLNGLLLGHCRVARHRIGVFSRDPCRRTRPNMMYPKAPLEIVKTYQKNAFFRNGPRRTRKQRRRNGPAVGDNRGTHQADFFPSNNEADEEMSGIEEEKSPPLCHGTDRKAVLKSKIDRSMANELKKELDRWNLFELYENRFLDLVRGRQIKGLKVLFLIRQYPESREGA